MQKKRSVLPFVVFVSLIMIIALVFGIGYKFKPSKERYDLTTYFGVDVDSVSAMALMVDDVLLEEVANYIDGDMYIEYDILIDYICDRFFWDEELSCLIYVMPDGSRILKSEGNFFVEDDVVFVNWDTITAYAQINYYIAENPMRIVINTQDSVMDFADVKKTAVIRYRAGVKSPILRDVEKGDKLKVLDTVDDWTHVVSEDGFIGYIESKYLTKSYEDSYDLLNSDQVYEGKQLDDKVCMAWHQMTSSSGNDTLIEKISSVKGLNVISPTWFFMTDDQGSIKSLADSSYVETCHRLGIQVWALLENISYDIDEYSVFSRYSIRQKVIATLISECLRYDIDGINLDFEQLNAEAGEGYVQFIRELSIECHRNDIILSVDNYVPYNFNSFYNRSEQAVFADYVIVMSYDEHLNDSTGAGSVASLDYVKKGIDDTLKEVPKEKLINAIPFYTRLWTETPKTNEEIASENPSEEYSSFNLSWETMGMDAASQYIADNDMECNWDEEIGQYYCEGEKDGTVLKIWLEDEKSLEEKLKLIQERDIAGIAAWKLGLETDEVWKLIEKYYPE